MNNNKLLHAIAKNCTGWNIRPSINWIEFKGNKFVATDTIKLIEVTTEKEIWNFNIWSQAILKDKNNSDLNILEKRTTLKFPDYEKFFRDSHDIKIKLDPKMLKDLCECFIYWDYETIELCINWPLDALQIEWCKKDVVKEIKGKLQDIKTMKALLMPRTK